MDIDATLKQFEPFGVKLGLESIQRLLARLDNPQARVPIVHVAGSNGKGSVCAYLSSVLTQAGYRVGRYTSPHLVDWCERICLNNQPIAPADLDRVLQTVIAAIDADDPLTQFEVITAAAWLYFAQQQVDLAVVEVGLGGRLDATNVCDRPLVSVITSLSLEHWQRLGPTLADIAREKAGILKPNCPAVIGQLPPEAAAVVHRRLAQLNCPATYPQPARDLGDGWAIYRGIEEQAVILESEPSEPAQQGIVQIETVIRYRLPLQGAIQLHNSALAIATLLLLRQQGWEISDAAIADGIGKTQWAGRLQWFSWQGHKLLIDGAHNPASAEVLRQFIDRHCDRPTPVHWVMGMLSTKDHADVFRALLRSGDSLFLVPVPDHSTAEPGQLAELAQQICPTLHHCRTEADVFAALEAAVKSGDDSLTVLCGSLYLIGHFFRQVRS